MLINLNWLQKKRTKITLKNSFIFRDPRPGKAVHHNFSSSKPEGGEGGDPKQSFSFFFVLSLTRNMAEFSSSTFLMSWNSPSILIFTATTTTTTRSVALFHLPFALVSIFEFVFLRIEHKNRSHFDSRRTHTQVREGFEVMIGATFKRNSPSFMPWSKWRKKKKKQERKKHNFLSLSWIW